MKEIKEKLFAGDNFLLLVNGHGGVGKTSLAARYYHDYCNDYKHAAWVLSEKSIANAILLLSTPLRVTFEETMPTEQRLQQLVAAIVELGKPCLLVIDNVDEPEDLGKYYLLLRQCSNFHLLLTSRITWFEQAETYEVAGLPEPEALALFKKYYPKHTESEDNLFKQIRLAADCNTLVIELLAKNLYIQNRLKANYTLENLLTDLQQKGVLGLSKSTAVGGIGYHAKEGIFRKEDPKDVIAAMYDLGELSHPENVLLSVFAVLPAENLSYEILEALLPETELLEENLLALSQKGWLDYNEPTASFKISPVVQEITRNKNQQLLQDNDKLINSLLDQLDYQSGTGHFINCNYIDAATYTRYAESLHQVNGNSAILYDRIGNYYETTGDLSQALANYEKYNQLEAQLYEAYPDNIGFKNGLAISYQNLGNIQSSLGNLDKALAYYGQYNELKAQLYEAYPDNVEFKNGLAISYSKLGRLYQNGFQDKEKATIYFQSAKKIWTELANSFPDYVEFRNNLDWAEKTLTAL